MLRKIELINELCKYYAYNCGDNDEDDKAILIEINSVINCKNLNCLSTWTNAPGQNDINGDLNPCYSCLFNEVNEENKDLQCKFPLPFVSYVRY